MKKDRSNKSEALVSALELPGDLFLGLPILSMEGNRTLCIVNHRGIVRLGNEDIVVAINSGAIGISGRSLVIPRFSKDIIEIAGVIESVSFLT